MIVLWQTDQTQKCNFHLLFLKIWAFKGYKSSILVSLSNFQVKNPNKQEEILKKISESWVFGSGLFVKSLSSEKKWPTLKYLIK